jgi:FkbM family methyltransferase
MPAISLVRRVANYAYENAFPLYRLCYGAFKAYSGREERKVLRDTLVAGAVVVDAGANIGAYSQFLSRCVGQTGVVHSFEPAPKNFRRLQSATQNLTNVRLHQAAVGEQSGRSKLYLSDRLNVDHRTYTTGRDSRPVIEIDMIALDDYFTPGERVDLIKMDIQGYELHGLRGAKRVLQENPRIQLLLELWPAGLEQAGDNWEHLVEMLNGLGMNLALVSTSGLVSFDTRGVRRDPSWYVNLFASRSQSKNIPPTRH